MFLFLSSFLSDLPHTSAFQVVTEPPNGLKLNLRSTYHKITNQALADCPHQSFSPLVYVKRFYIAWYTVQTCCNRVGFNYRYETKAQDITDYLCRFKIRMQVKTNLRHSTYLNRAPSSVWNVSGGISDASQTMEGMRTSRQTSAY